MVLTDNKGNPVVIFDTQISEGAFGLAYINFGINNGQPDETLKFSCKVTETSVIETKLMTILTQYVLETSFPNFPLMYAYLKCENVDVAFEEIIGNLPNSNDPNANTTNYTIICSELAESDLATWFEIIKLERKDIYDAPIKSIIAQLLCAVYKMHTLGYVHNDLHMGNILLHKIEPGGYWRYTFNENENDWCIQNEGFVLVLWDFGECLERTIDEKGTDDYLPFDVFKDVFKDLDSFHQIYKPFADLADLNIKDLTDLNIKEKEAFQNARQYLPVISQQGEQINEKPFIMIM